MNTIRKSEQTFQLTVRLVALAGFLAVSLLLMLAHAGAQGPSILQGTVTDNKGGLIPKATVTIRSEATGKTIAVTADATGRFVSPGLPAGAYDVETSAPGFTKFSQKGVSAPGEVNLPLQIGSATSEITVDADATHSVAGRWPRWTRCFRRPRPAPRSLRRSFRTSPRP